MRLTITLAAAAVALLNGCASSTEPRADRSQYFHSSNVTSFAAPDNRTLYVRVGVRDVYRFDLMAPCQNIDWNQRLALVARPGPWICRGMDATVVSRARGPGQQRCPASHMRRLTPEEIAALPPRSRP